MYTEQLESIDSTQTYLLERYSELSTHSSNILILSDSQTHGRGRRGNKWISLPNSILCSFTLKPNDELTLTPLEVGVLTVQFLQTRFKQQLKLKWPNDFFNLNYEKCGGVIIDLISNGGTSIIGLGINLGQFSTSEIETKVSSVTNTNFSRQEKLELSKELYEFILKNRFTSSSNLIRSWKQLCVHLNQEVEIRSDHNSQKGFFTGVNHQGAAILDGNAESPIYSGSLFING